MTDPQDRKRQREALRAKRQAKQKVSRLLTAAAVLLVAVIVIAALIGRGCTPAQPDPTDPPTQPPVETTVPPTSGDTQPDSTAAPEDSTVPVETSTPVSETTVIHFVAGGDVNITEKTIASGGIDYNYTQTFMDVAPLLAGADLTTLNLEGTLCGAPFGSTASAPQSFIEALRRAGVDMLQLANSYSMYRGVSGLRTTISNVTAAGLTPIGVFNDSEDFQRTGGFTLFNVKGVKVAVVAFTKGMLEGTGIPSADYREMINILYTDFDSTYQKVDTQRITDILDAVASQKPDVTIALVHWGSENNDTHSRSQTTIKNLMLENGVDAIIGTHPHRVQEIEYDDEDGTLVAYSLGDFISDAVTSGTEYSILLDLEITKNNKTGSTAITGYNYTPLLTVAEEDEPLRVVRIQEAIAAYDSNYVGKVSDSTYSKLTYALKRIEARVQSD